MVKKDPNTGSVGTVSATDVQNDTEYLCPVTIGGQNLNLDFDTGSADCWVFSSKLPSGTQREHLQNKGQIYDPSKSSTWRAAKGETWQIQYGDGSTASGTCGTDHVVIGGVSISNQTIEIADKMSEAFAQGTSDGLMGLAFVSPLMHCRSHDTVHPQTSTKALA